MTSIFVRYRCVKCRHRLKSNQTVCGYCNWEDKPDLARYMAKSVARHRVALFWDSVADIVFARRNILRAQTQPGDVRKSKRFLRLHWGTALVLNALACVLLAANVVDRSFWLGGEKAVSNSQTTTACYGWPAIALETTREIVPPLNSTAIQTMDRTILWRRNVAINACVAFTILAIVWYIMEWFLMTRAQADP